MSFNANRKENIAMAKFQNKSKVTSDIAKKGFIQHEMGILGHAIPSHI